MVPVIQYHMIDKPSRASRVRGGFTPPGRFAKQMRHLKEQGLVFYTAAELIDHYREQGEFPANGITVTFDDGCRDNVARGNSGDGEERNRIWVAHNKSQIVA